MFIFVCNIDDSKNKRNMFEKRRVSLFIFICYVTNYLLLKLFFISLSAKKEDDFLNCYIRKQDHLSLTIKSNEWRNILT